MDIAVQEEPDEALRKHLRANILVKTFYGMVDSWTLDEREACQLNEEVLVMCVNSYFKDIKRKKAFHGIKFADAHKRASYMMKWIMKFRPVQILKSSTKRVLMVNEFFATAHALKMLNVSPKTMPETMREHLLYMLRFRTFDPNAVAMSFFLLQKLQSGAACSSHGE